MAQSEASISVICLTMTQLSCYGAELYEKLEAETSQATGFKRNGSLAIARTEGRFTEVKRIASLQPMMPPPMMTTRA